MYKQEDEEEEPGIATTIEAPVLDFDDDPDTVIEFTIVHHGCALYLYVVPILYYDIQYLLGCYSFNTTVCDSDNRIDSTPVDQDLVHYGVVYTYVYAYYVVQLLLYNIQRSIGFNDINTTVCDNNNIQRSIEYNNDDNNINTTVCDNNNIQRSIEYNNDDNNFGFDRALAFDLVHDQSLFYIYGVDTISDHDHLLLRVIFCSVILWKNPCVVLLLSHRVLQKKNQFTTIAEDTTSTTTCLIVCTTVIDNTMTNNTTRIMEEEVQDRIIKSKTTCTTTTNNNDAVHDVVKCDHTNSIVVPGQVPHNITYNNNNNNHIYKNVPNDSNKLMLMKKIFNVTVFDVDVDTYYYRNRDHGDDRNNDREIAFDIKDNTAGDINGRASCGVGTLRFAHYDINTIRCENNNTLPFYLPCKQVLFRVYDKDNNSDFIFGMIHNNNGYAYCSIVIHNTIRNNNINVCDDTTCYGCISHNGVDTIPDNDGENGCGMDNEVPVLVRVLHCGMLRVEYNIKAYNYSTFSLTMTIMIVENNQVQVCDDIISMTVAGVHDTDSDIEYESIYTTNVVDIAHPGSVLDFCGAKSRFYDVQHSTSTAFFSVTTAFIRAIFNNMLDIDCDPVSSLVHYGVVYVYIYENDVAQQLYYNIQHFGPYNNNKCNNNRPQYVILDHTVHIQDDDTVNYVVNDIF